jgi:signal transduction histidine kinase
MNYFYFSSLLIFIINLGSAVLVLFKSKDKKLGYLWGLVCVSLTIWGAGGINVSLSHDYAKAMFWWQIAHIGIILLPSFYFHFVYEFLKLRQKPVLLLAYFITLFLLFVDIAAPEYFLGSLRLLFGKYYWVSKSVLFVTVYLGGLCGLLLTYSFILLVKSYRSASGIRKEQLKYFILGTSIGWFGGSGNYLITLGYNVFPYSNILIAFYPFIIAYAIIRYQLLDIKLAATKATIFIGFYATVFGLPLYVGYSTQYWIIATFMAVVLSSLGPLAHKVLQEKAENFILAEQRRYQKILLQAASGMAKEHELEKLLRLIVYIVKKTVKIRFAAILLEDKENKVYRFRAIRDFHILPEWRSYTISFNHPFIGYVKQKHDPFIYSELPRNMQLDTLLPISLVVPSVSGNSSLGFMLLGEKINGKIYSADDINVFRILSHQTALSIENCMFINEFRLAQEKIFSAEKLASIGGLAEGVAHQVNNRLNHFSMAAGEMKFELEAFMEHHKAFIEQNQEFKKTFSYLNELADSINTNVRRTDGILKGILNYARIEAKETMFSTFSLKETVDLSLDLLKIKHHLSNFQIESESGESDAVYAVKSQLMECVYNIIDNAYEATLDKLNMLPEPEKEHYCPKISFKVVQNPSSSLIQFKDNGIGIKKEQRQKIFAPFFTTKSSYKSGTGIGMYVVKRMIEENHHGRIWFESEYGVGTQIFMELPNKII